MCILKCAVLLLVFISILVISNHCLNIVNKVVKCNTEFALILYFNMVKV